MVTIETEKIFDLAAYLKRQYNYEYTTMEDLLITDFIEYEGVGAHALLWIKIDNEKYLFKEIKHYEFLGELLSKEFAEILNIFCAEYKLCKLNDKIGILSKKFTKKNENIILGAQIIQEVLDNYPYLNAKNAILLNDPNFILYNVSPKILEIKKELRLKAIYDNLNSLEQLWSIFTIYLELNKENRDYIAPFMDYLIKTFFFDLITMQGDRHAGNWGIIRQQNSKQITPCYLFDNSACFNLGNDKLENLIASFNSYTLAFQKKLASGVNPPKQFLDLLYKHKMLLVPTEESIRNLKTNKRDNNLELLDYFLKYSDETYINLFSQYLDKLKNVKMAEILTKLETNEHLKIEPVLKDYLITIYNWNLNLLNSKLKSYSKGSGKNV